LPKTCCRRRNRCFTPYCRNSSRVRTQALNFLFDAFSSREPVSTSLENALKRIGALARPAADARKAA
jgi:hypothetical protein